MPSATLIAENLKPRSSAPKLVSVNENSFIAATDFPELINIRTGKNIWSVSEIGHIQQVAVDTRSGLVVTSYGGSFMVAFSLHNGAKRATFPVTAHNFSNSACVRSIRYQIYTIELIFFPFFSDFNYFNRW